MLLGIPVTFAGLRYSDGGDGGQGGQGSAGQGGGNGKGGMRQGGVSTGMVGLLIFGPNGRGQTYVPGGDPSHRKRVPGGEGIRMGQERPPQGAGSAIQAQMHGWTEMVAVHWSGEGEGHPYQLVRFCPIASKH